MYTFHGPTAPVAPIAPRPAPAAEEEESPTRMLRTLLGGGGSSGVHPSVLQATLDSIPYASLSPESIIALVRTRVRDMDRQVATITGALESRQREATELSAHLQELRAFQEATRTGRRDGHADMSTAPPPEYAHHGADLHEWAASLEFRNGYVVNEGSIQSLIDDVNEQLREVNSGNEMLMIQLQSTMQQRTQIIQLGSNMLKAYDEATDSIVGNMR